MKIRTAVLIKAIDQIIGDQEKSRTEWEKLVAQWNKENAATWRKEKWPKFVALRDKITEHARSRKPITKDDLIAIFGSYGYGRDVVYDAVFFHNEKPNTSITLADGTVHYRPDHINVETLKATRGLLVALADDVVTDNQITRLGFKDQILPIFQLATRLGGVIT